MVRLQGRTAHSQSAELFQRSIVGDLRACGWQTIQGALTEGGVLDVLCWKDGCRVALALDRGAPRARSLAVLRATSGVEARIVGLREGFAKLSLPAGVDAIACAWPPRLYTAEQPRGYAPRVSK